MSGYREKDVQYHDANAHEYDNIVVAPRLITNDALYKKFQKIIRGQKMLDLGCGTGHMTYRFQNSFQEIVAVDHSSAMLTIAKGKLKNTRSKNVTFICSTPEDYLRNAAECAFDVVCCTGFLHHLTETDLNATIAGVARALRPGGIAITSEPIYVEPHTVPPRILAWNAKSIAATLHYSNSAIAAPDEAPIIIDVLFDALGKSNLSIKKVSRNWEIFPRTLPPSIADLIYIRLLNMIYGKKGNVLTVASQKRVG